MNQKSFTLVELLVVTGIILVLAAIILPQYRVGERKFALQRSAHKLAQDIRRAQEMAMSAKEFEGSMPQGGYGIYFYKFEFAGIDFPHQYVLFADSNSDQTMTLPAEQVEIIELEKGVQFSDFYLDGAPSDGTVFTFVPPDPQTCINQCANDSTSIIISLESDSTQTETITLNKIGLVDIE